MPTSPFDRRGLDCGGLVANAERETLRPHGVAELVGTTPVRHDGRGSGGDFARHVGGFEVQPPLDSWRRWAIGFTIIDSPCRAELVSAALADLGICILAGDGGEDCGTEPGRDLTVALPPWLDVPALEYALVRAGVRDVRAHSMADAGPSHPVPASI